MKNLAQLAFDHMWMILFSDEEIVDADYSVRLLEELSLVLSQFNSSEKAALAEVAQDTKSRLLAEPDEYGYTPRDLVTDEQRQFLDDVIAQDIYNEVWWTT
ncbi:hypothetical protein OAS39_07800 [Pirellulales bacterium]|nr:hypothetical protein [Pirellulales bacterium]